MSGSDRFISMSLDDIIKMRRGNNSSSRAGSLASTSRNSRGRGQSRAGGQRFAQRGRGQGRGRGAQRNRQQLTPQRRFRGQQGGTLSSWQSRQSLASQGRNQQRVGGLRAWSNQRSLASVQGRRQQSLGSVPRGRQQGAGPVRRGRQQSVAPLGRRQNVAPLGRRQNVLLTRGAVNIRNNLPRNQIRTRGTRLQPAQLARNRVRLAAQILVRRKRQLLQLQTQVQSQRGGRLNLRRGGFERAINLRGGIMNNRRGNRRGAMTNRRGALLNKLATRAQVTYNTGTARANRNRESQAQSQMLSVNIQNERAVGTSPPQIPQLLVINRPPVNRPRNTGPMSHMALAAIARRQNVARQQQAQPAFVLEEEEEYVPVPTAPGRKLTLHERFSQS